VRKAWEKPLFVRISATDWAEFPERGEDGQWKQWGIEQSKIFVGEMKKIGVDLIDCSSGGNWDKQKIPGVPGYQVSYLSITTENLSGIIMRPPGSIRRSS
jgi:2,4-dienoyl-CoA reductase-like NADH-dependent reductase (Old Yellow Enzyme family)